MESLNLSSSYFGWYYARLILEEIARYEDFFHILLACITATMYHKEPFEWDNEFGRRILRHKIKGIALLRRRLSSPTAITDNGILLSIIELSHLEIVSNDRSAAILHRRELERMIEKRGGLRHLGGEPGIRALIEL